MEGSHSLQYQRYEDLFDTIKGVHTKYFSDMGKRLYRLLLLDKLRVAIEEVEYYCEKGKSELLMNIASDFSYKELSEDKRWDSKDEGSSLKVPNKERSTYRLLGDDVITADYIKNVTDSFQFNEKQMLMNESVNDVELKNMLLAIGVRSTVSDGVLEYMINESINTLRTKMVELDKILSNPNELFYEGLYDSEFSPMKTMKLRSETKTNFEEWKAVHLNIGSKENKIERLNDYLVECMIELFKKDLLENVVEVKSRKERQVYRNHLNIFDFQSFNGADGLNFEKLYYLLVELLDCPAKQIKSFPIYEPNKNNIGRLIYINRHHWTQEKKNKFIQFILLLQLIQE